MMIGVVGWCTSVDTRQETHMGRGERHVRICGSAEDGLLYRKVLMYRQRPRRRNPEFQFRVLIVGRANAGKTSILQRVCETTESPIIYRRRLGAKEPEEVSGTTFCLLSDLTADQVKLDPSIDVSDNSSSFPCCFF